VCTARPLEANTTEKRQIKDREKIGKRQREDREKTEKTDLGEACVLLAHWLKNGVKKKREKTGKRQVIDRVETKEKLYQLSVCTARPL
jgi:hypothetical protein